MKYNHLCRVDLMDHGLYQIWELNDRLVSNRYLQLGSPYSSRYMYINTYSKVLSYKRSLKHSDYQWTQVTLDYAFDMILEDVLVEYIDETP